MERGAAARLPLARLIAVKRLTDGRPGPESIRHTVLRTDVRPPPGPTTVAPMPELESQASGRRPTLAHDGLQQGRLAFWALHSDSDDTTLPSLPGYSLSICIPTDRYCGSEGLGSRCTGDPGRSCCSPGTPRSPTRNPARVRSARWRDHGSFLDPLDHSHLSGAAQGLRQVVPASASS